jgi:glycosyltransferase involved in cell wall biosynthesis
MTRRTRRRLMPPRPRIAVNARALRSPVTGIGRYVRALMREVERDGRFAADYFCALRWGRGLDEVPVRIATADPGGVARRVTQVIRSLRPVTRSIERFRFASGLEREDFAFYFEPAYIPFPTALPTVITIHDLSHVRHPETHPAIRVRELERELPAAIAKAARILTVSEFTRREVIDVFGVDPARVVATPLGVEPQFFPRAGGETARVLTGLDLTHGRYFLAVGTLEPRKNILATVDAHSRLPARMREAWPLVVVGMKGWHTRGITRALALAQARGDVRVLGHVGEDELPLLYAGAAMLSYPSIYEGFGLPPLEAMASGVPVAASNRASLPEVVGNAGILLEPDDIEGLTRAMLRIVDDAAFARDLAARGLARAQSFTWTRCAAVTMRSWESLLETG